MSVQQVVIAGPVGVNGLCAAVSIPLSVPALHAGAAAGEAVATG